MRFNLIFLILISCPTLFAQVFDFNELLANQPLQYEHIIDQMCLNSSGLNESVIIPKYLSGNNLETSLCSCSSANMIYDPRIFKCVQGNIAELSPEEACLATNGQYNSISHSCLCKLNMLPYKPELSICGLGVTMPSNNDLGNYYIPEISSSLETTHQTTYLESIRDALLKCNEIIVDTNHESKVVNLLSTDLLFYFNSSPRCIKTGNIPISSEFFIKNLHSTCPSIKELYSSYSNYTLNTTLSAFPTERIHTLKEEFDTVRDQNEARLNYEVSNCY